MEKRQRYLMIAVGVLLAFGVVSRLVPWLLDPITSADKRIRSYQRKIKEYRGKIEQKPFLLEKYRSLASKTLGLSETEAGQALHAKMVEVAKTSRLQRPTIGQAFLRSFTDQETRSRITIVKVAISGQGSIAEVVRFLENFYKLPYLVRIRTLSLNPFHQRKGMLLKINADVEALVLQSHPLVDPETVETAELDMKKLPPSDRYKPEKAKFYQQVVQKNIFEPVVKVASEQPKERTPVRGRPPRRGRDAREDVILVLATRYPWVDPQDGTEYLIQEAVTRNSRTKEKLVRRVGEDFHGQGTLVYVDSYGAVVRTPQKQYLVFPLGKTLKDGESLSPEMHPDLYRAVQEIETQTK